MAIAEAYCYSFCYHYDKRLFDRNGLYDFLYERNYQPWFCNMVKGIASARALKDWLLGIHTGESFATAIPNWSLDQRQRLGQTYLKNLARDFIVWVGWGASLKSWIIKYYHDDLVRCLEMDGYVFRDNGLYQSEEQVLDVEAEAGLLEKLYTTLGLPDKAFTFQFLRLAEEHYVNGRWSDSIGNARKFLEAILQQVASKHASKVKRAPLNDSTLQQPAAIRDYLESEGLVEKKERELLDKLYGLLSHTGSHPYMAEKDQARLLRQDSLTWTQFIMLRLEDALAATTT